jgi:hypothetical protein
MRRYSVKKGALVLKRALMSRQKHFLVQAFDAAKGEPHWPKGSTARQKYDRLPVNAIFCIQPLRHHQA